MQALVLDGFKPVVPFSADVTSVLGSELTRCGFDTEVIPLARMRIASCQGCFDCWLKTPGKCRLDDDFEAVARAYVRSDLAVFWTPVVFGSYASGMKSVLERLLGMLTPFLRLEGGETHHRPRYLRNPALFGLGCLTAAEPVWGELFERLVARNAANLRSPRHAAAVVRDEADWPGARKALRSFLRLIGEVR